VHPGQQFDHQGGAVDAQRVQGVGKLASAGFQILEHQHEPAGDRIERRTVADRHVSEQRGQLAIEA
jgi:hypothetical protein